MYKQCIKCKQELPATKEYFYTTKHHSDGLRSECKQCRLEAQRQYRKQNPDKHKEYVLKHRYGITPEQKLRLFVKQRGKCAICGEEKKLSEFCIDHDHETDEIRGLLCQHCNIGLGNFKDNPEILENALEYLEKKDE